MLEVGVEGEEGQGPRSRGRQTACDRMVCPKCTCPLLAITVLAVGPYNQSSLVSTGMGPDTVSWELCVGGFQALAHQLWGLGEWVSSLVLHIRNCVFL